MTKTVSYSFIIIEFFIVIFGRITGVFGISFFMQNVLKIKNFKISFTEKNILSFAGSIRGAIAFGLAISIQTKNQKIKEVLVSSTLVLVFFTTIVFGGLMPFALKLFKSFLPKDQNKQPLLQDEYGHGHDKNEEGNIKFVEFSHPNFQKWDGVVSKEKDINVLKETLSYWLFNYWSEFDNNYMKKRLCHDWPNCKIQNDELSEKIVDLADEYNDQIKKNQQNNLAAAKDADNLVDNLRNKNLTNDFEMKQNSHNNLNNHNINKTNMKVAFSEKNFDDIEISIHK